MAIRFIFDLDGTVTATESLPLIAAHFGVEEDIAGLTAETVAGDLPFEESLTRRVEVLGAFSVAEVRALVAGMPVLPLVLAFIQARREACVIATGNLDVWIADLARRIGCEVWSSTARVAGDRVVGIARILDKSDVVETYRREGHRVVFVGDGHNDLGAMQRADIAIATGVVHPPPPAVLDACDHAVTREDALVALLEEIEARGV